jgi:alpha-1,3-mannosyl-glycoprotein beta-1,2-N-acetylglucosaminyltransferase
MRIVSPYTVLAFVVVWTIIILLASRQFLFNAHQSWFQHEEQKMVQELSVKLDNLDSRDTRQLNAVYAEVKRVGVMLHQIQECLRFDNCSEKKNRPTRSAVTTQPATIEPSVAVLVIACNRDTYIRRTLDSLLKHRPSAGLFPIIVSQDCGHTPTANVISSYGNRLTHIKQPDLSDIVLTKEKKDIKNMKALKGYYKISRHYRWALGQVFDEMGYNYVLIVEDDLEVAPDFFSYFSALRRLLDRDHTIWCISAWNDNGKPDNVDLQSNAKLYRSDFFPGLGWMMTRSLWKELQPKWPEKYWDDWMREPAQRQGRSCIRPEISRTITFGDKGVSAGQFYRQHLQYIKLNSDPVDFSKLNLSQLQEAEYDRLFLGRVLALPSLSVTDVVNQRRPELREVQVTYSTHKEFEANAKKMKIMFDFRVSG